MQRMSPSGFVNGLKISLVVVVLTLAYPETTDCQTCDPNNGCCVCETKYGKPARCLYPGSPIPTGPDEVVYAVGDSAGCCQFYNFTRRLVNGQYQSRIIRNVASTSCSTCPEMTCIDTGKPNEWAACCQSDVDRGNCDVNIAIPDRCFNTDI